MKLSDNGSVMVFAQRAWQALAGVITLAFHGAWLRDALPGLPRFVTIRRDSKNYRLQLNYMPRSNFLLVPCLAWKLEFLGSSVELVGIFWKIDCYL